MILSSYICRHKNDMNKLLTILFLLVSLQLKATGKANRPSPEMIPVLGSVKVSPNFVKPKMEKLDRAVADSVLARHVAEVPAIRKQSKRYRPASAPGLHKKLNWVFAY